MGTRLKQLFSASLRQLGYQIERVDRANQSGASDESVIGHDVCLRQLAKRGYVPRAVMDVGAAHGSWTRLALRHWPDASYFLVDPLHEHRIHFEQLQTAVPGVSFIIAAAGVQVGQLTLGVASNLDGSSLLYPGHEQRLVPVVTVDGLVADGRASPPQVLKLDVQGYELQVLQGATETLKSCDLVLLETQLFRFTPSMALFHEVVGWMVQRNFRPYEIVDVLRRPLDNAMGQCDVLFARGDHWLLSNTQWA